MKTTAADHQADNPKLKRRMRWRIIPVLIVALAIANVVRVRMSADLDAMTRNMQTMLTVVVSLPLLFVWWLFLSGLRWRTRLIGAGLLILCIVGLKQLVRFDGSIDGSGRPKIVWKWTPRRSGELGYSRAVSPVKELPKLEAAFDYPGYLGRDRSGVITDIQLERDWSAHPPQQLWRQAIGLGWSAFFCQRVLMLAACSCS